MYNGKEKNIKTPAFSKRRFYFRANGIGAYHAAPAALMIAAGLGLAAVISSVPDYGVLDAFAESVSSPYVQKASVYSQDADVNEKQSVPEFKHIPTLYPELTELKHCNAEVTGEYYDFTKYCTKVSSDEAEEKLDFSAEIDELIREHEEAAGQVVCAGNRNLYLDHYHYQRKPSKIPSYQGESVRYNENGIPMSQMKPPDDFRLDENGVPENYYYAIEGHGTAYYGGVMTATGSPTRQGVVAVDPRVIPYGTEMYITSLDGKVVYGFCRAEDTGGFIYYENGATVDLFMDRYEDCCKWGWRGVKIYILPSSYK